MACEPRGSRMACGSNVDQKHSIHLELGFGGRRLGERRAAAWWELRLDLFEAYVDVLEEGECSPERHLSLLKHRLGAVGLREFKNFTPVENVNADDVYKCTLKQLQERGKDVWCASCAALGWLVDRMLINNIRSTSSRDLEVDGWGKGE
ncbi:hypothetical protein NDU88_006204 [Pleurodeles waltl]|uniref:Uncharacterized protein n=1 Tax=Pleurodeles waltl TaxID=8319 RepID=A0AAV7SNV8_PLEWA|nr:hypothetical protein NDU88_006204 [Pleurodeles waltl]